MPHKVPPEVAAAIVAEYTDGGYTGALAAKYGYSTSTLHRVYREAGVTADRARSGAASWVRRTGLPADEGDQQTGFRWCGKCRERKPMDAFYWTSPAKKSRMRICKAVQVPAQQGRTEPPGASSQAPLRTDAQAVRPATR